MTLFTVFGSTGFIGRHVCEALRSANHEVQTFDRGSILTAPTILGHAIYCIGMTGNYRSQPYATVDAHVNLLSKILQTHSYESFLYLSSTRVYRGLSQDMLAEETTPIPLTPDRDSIYDYSKLLGEALCLSHPLTTVRVARVSNVYGIGMSENSFLGALYANLTRDGHISIQDHPESSKDYIHIEDVVAQLTYIALHGRHRLYNIASGKRISCQEIADTLIKAGNQVGFATTTTQPRIFPTISIARAVRECSACVHDILVDLPNIFSTTGDSHHDGCH